MDMMYDVQEGISTRHNPEFTSVEIYQAYADFNDMMTLMEDMVVKITMQLHKSSRIPYGTSVPASEKSKDNEGENDSILYENGTPVTSVQGVTVAPTPAVMLELAAPWKRITMCDCVFEATGIQMKPLIEKRASLQDIIKAIETSEYFCQLAGMYQSSENDEQNDSSSISSTGNRNKVDLAIYNKLRTALRHYRSGALESTISPGIVLNTLFETCCEHTLIQPTFITEYPIEVSPLSKALRLPKIDGSNARIGEEVLSPFFVERFEMFMVRYVSMTQALLA